MIIEKYEQYKLLGYFHSIFSHPIFKARITGLVDQLLYWINDHNYLFQYPDPDTEEEGIDGNAHFNSRRSESKPAMIQELMQFVEHLNDHYRKSRTVDRSELERKLDWLGRLLKLTPAMKELVGFYYRLDCYEVVDDFVHIIQQKNKKALYYGPLISCILNLDPQVYRSQIDQSSMLFSILIARMDPNHDNQDYEVTSWIKILLSKEIRSCRQMEKELLGCPLKAGLDWDDYLFMQSEIDLIESIMARSLKYRSTGINLLFYGEPGTGKTEFSKTLCRRLGIHLYHSEKRDDMFDQEPNRDDRVRQLLMMQRMLSGYPDSACILFDEAEDYFENRCFTMMNSRSKLFTNNLLENNPVPVIWITNRIDSMDNAYLRRFTHIVKFKRLPPNVRRKIWENNLHHYRISLPETQLNDLTRRYDIAPALISGAVRVAGLANGDHNAIRKVVEGKLQAMNGGHRITSGTVSTWCYNYDLANTDLDLRRLVEMAAGMSRRDFSLCLYGVSGSGKSAFGRDLAEKMGMEVIQKRASDLLSKWVGETEVQIAQAFEEAIDRNSILIIDEAESFLRDRRLAQRSWEITQVNELLTWMESHPLPLICTTNLMDDIDQAGLRRFTFKVRFKPLTSIQLRQAFRHFWRLETEADMEGLIGLAPGDFAVVDQRLRLMNLPLHYDTIRAMLMEELQFKSPVSRPIGFCHPRHSGSGCS